MLKEKGLFWSLSLQGYAIKRIVFDGMIRVVFDDANESYLDFHSDFEIERYNQTQVVSPKTKDALGCIYDLFGIPLKEAKADKSGYLFLEFEQSVFISVPDGPNENWHFTSHTPHGHSLYMHGGVGCTTIVG